MYRFDGMDMDIDAIYDDVRVVENVENLAFAEEEEILLFLLINIIPRRHRRQKLRKTKRKRKRPQPEGDYVED